tara:strand:+ start:111 stop:878 length:768 start_codon:yes stop_codon:yes gene_type:complete
MKENWKDIKGFKDKYQVSDLGRVRSLDRTTITSNGRKLFIKGKVLKLNRSSPEGYVRVILYGKNTKSYIRFVHRLVAQAFIPNPENKPEVNHKWGDKSDNRSNSLEWCTRSENVIHAFKTGLNPQRGEYNSKLSEIQVREICNLLDNSNMTQEEIAKEYGVLKPHIHRIDVGDRWNWLTDRKGKVENRGFKIVENCRGEIFRKLTEAANKYKVSTTNISKSCNSNGYYSAGRYPDGTLIKWNYVDTTLGPIKEGS